MKILICGDSFAADWTVKYPNNKGWPNLLANDFLITNLAQAGVSEYKIYLQSESINDVDQYDAFIVSHTSPYRSVTRRHPIHHSDCLHANADLMLADIEYHYRNRFLERFINPSLRAARNYIKYHYDDRYHEESYKLFRLAVNQKFPSNKTIIISNFPAVTPYPNELNFIDLSTLQKDNPGLMNHLSDKGNQIMYDILTSKLKLL